MASGCDWPQKGRNEETIGVNSTEFEEDILKFIRSSGPSPSYDLAQRVAHATLARVSGQLLALIGGPGTRKTWTYISLLSELLHENKLRVLIVAPKNKALDDVAVRIHKTFQQHPSLKNKIIYCV